MPSSFPSPVPPNTFCLKLPDCSKALLSKQYNSNGRKPPLIHLATPAPPPRVKTNQVKKQSLMHTFYGVDTPSSIVRSQLRTPPVKRQSPFQFNAPSGADDQTTSPSTITVDPFVLSALKRVVLNDLVHVGSGSRS